MFEWLTDDTLWEIIKFLPKEDQVNVRAVQRRFWRVINDRFELVRWSWVSLRNEYLFERWCRKIPHSLSTVYFVNGILIYAFDNKFYAGWKYLLKERQIHQDDSFKFSNRELMNLFTVQHAHLLIPLLDLDIEDLTLLEPESNSTPLFAALLFPSALESLLKATLFNNVESLQRVFIETPLVTFRQHEISQSVLHYLIELDMYVQLALLLQRGLSLSTIEDNETLLRQAIFRSNIQVMYLLIKGGIKPNFGECTHFGLELSTLNNRFPSEILDVILNERHHLISYWTIFVIVNTILHQTPSDKKTTKLLVFRKYYPSFIRIVTVGHIVHRWMMYYCCTAGSLGVVIAFMLIICVTSLVGILFLYFFTNEILQTKIPPLYTGCHVTS